MMIQKKPILGLLLFATVVLAAWPVSYAYDTQSEGVNVANIQRMGYHVIMKAGKVYNFKFSDGTTAYFQKLPGFGSLKFKQVSEADYDNNPGEDGPESSNMIGGGSPTGGSGYYGGGITVPSGTSGSNWICWSTEDGVACQAQTDPGFNSF